MSEHGRENIKGTVTIKLNPELVLKFKDKCSELGIKETPVKVKIFEQAMRKFLREK